MVGLTLLLTQIKVVRKLVASQVILKRKLCPQTQVGLISKNYINKYHHLIMLTSSLTLYQEVCVTPEAIVILKLLINQL